MNAVRGALSEMTLPAPAGERAPLQDRDGDLRVLGPLGEGGMGVVELAYQASLRRDVAIKRLRPRGARASGCDSSAQARAAMLHEAMICGSLEHPNIVPIHSVRHDTDGNPLIVMKRIEGRRWTDSLPGAGRAAGDDPAQLRKHLEIFVQVCRAVEYAHSRGVIHRDLKPDNVMIGSFGEVYLCDWGIAYQCSGDAGQRDDAVVGTPAYMAPEMLEGTGPQIGAHTDVYLLGSILHQLIGGKAPHAHDDVAQSLRSVRQAAVPTFGVDAPGELAAIARRALEPRPSRRFGGVAELRDAVERFVEHEGSRRLADQAEASLALLRVLLAREDAAAQVREIYQRFAEARFGFNQALSSWSGNEAAREGLEEALRLMIELELERKNPGAARVLVEELGDRAPPSLRARVGTLEARALAAEQSATELALLQHDADFSIEARRRAAMVGSSVLMTAICAVLAALLHRVGALELTHEALIAFYVALGLQQVLFGLRWRKALFSNAANRGFMIVLLFVPPVYLANHCVAITLGMSAHSALVYAYFVLGAMGIVAAVLQREPTFALGAMMLVPCVAAIIAWPQHTFELVAATNLALLLPVGVRWGLCLGAPSVRGLRASAVVGAAAVSVSSASAKGAEKPRRLDGDPTLVRRRRARLGGALG